MSTPIQLIAIPGIVLLIQRAGFWPDRWFKRAPLGCPFCLGIYVSGVLGGLQLDFLFACAGVVTNTVVAGFAPWAFRWAETESVNPVTSDHKP